MSSEASVAFDVEESSLMELMAEAFQLSMKICYSELATDGSYLTPRSLTDAESRLPFFDVWTWADGLAHEYYHRHAEGRCSLKAMIDFDIADFEEKVKKDIEAMKIMTEKYKAVTLTTEEMLSRGYRGSWTLPKKD